MDQEYEDENYISGAKWNDWAPHYQVLDSIMIFKLIAKIIGFIVSFKRYRNEMWSLFYNIVYFDISTPEWNLTNRDMRHIDKFVYKLWYSGDRSGLFRPIDLLLYD